ncbi:MAG: transporter substrate-binding domain-containing protein [Coprobacillus sp.]|nr:transporter substrate-binding domain-containing protein [Coprobacillus sp.]
MNKKSLLLLPLLVVSLASCNSTKTYESWKDFKGETFVTVRGTNCEDAVKEVVKKPNFIYVDSPSEFEEVITSGEAIAAVTNEPNITYLAKKSETLDVYPTLVDREDYGFLFKKNSSLVSDVNSALKSITDSGDLAEVVDKWMFGDEPSIDVNSYRVYSDTTLTLAIAPDFAPCCYLDESGNPAGYEVELAYLIANTLNVNLEITQMEFSQLFSAVDNGSADFACCIITISEERGQSYSFSDPYYTGGVALLMDKDIVEPLKSTKTFTTLSDFDGATLATIGGASGVVDPAREAINDLNIKYYKSTEAALDALKGGRVDGLLRNRYNLEHYVSGDDSVMIFPEDVASDNYGFMLAKDSELTSQINTALTSLGSETISSLQQKWINADEDTRIDVDSYTVEETTSSGVIRYSFAAANEPFSYLIEEEVEEDAPSLGGESGEGGIIDLRTKYLNDGDDDDNDGGNSEDLGDANSGDSTESVSLPAGYEVELMYAIAKQLNMTLEVTSVPEFRDTFTEIDTDSADVVSGGISITSERKLTYDFSDTIFLGAVSIAIRSETYGG